MTDSENSENIVIKNNEEINYDNNKEDDSDFVDHSRIALLSSLFTEKQMDRYGEFKKSSLENRKKIRSTNKIEYPRIKKIIQTVLGDHVPISNAVQIIMHGIAKIHAGELVEEAKKVQYEDFNQNTSSINNINPKPLRPKHLREARRRLMLLGKIPTYQVKPQK